MLNIARLALQAGAPLLPLGRHIPFMIRQLLLEPALARCFAQAVSDGEFDLLSGRWLRLEISDLGLGWNLTRGREGLRVAERAEADVTIRGCWQDFLLLASRQEDPDTLFFRRRLIIEGDTELGLAIKNLMDSLDPDTLPPRFWQLIEALGKAAKHMAAEQKTASRRGPASRRAHYGSQI